MLLSSTWGKHSCMHVAGTAIALAAAALRPSKVCRGRCLLEEDGTVEIDQTANLTNSTTSIDIPVANLTQIFNATGPSSSAISNNTLPLDSDDSHRFENLPDSPLPSSSLQTSPILICPCNCTYVSASCCLSPIVWEDPSEQIQMKPPPANASVECDIGSGKWVPKPSASSSPTENEGGFIGMGSVKWNSSAAGPAMIPQYSSPT